MKYWRRLMVWIGILQTKPQAELKKLIEKNLHVEEQHECNHKMLSSIFPDRPDIWYRCTSCNQVWIITDAMVLNAKNLPKVVARLNQVIKMKNKKKTLKPYKKFKKERKR